MPRRAQVTAIPMKMPAFSERIALSFACALARSISSRTSRVVSSVMRWTRSPRASSSTRAATLPFLDVELRDVDVAQTLGGLDAVLVEQLEQLEHVAHAVEVDPVVAGQVLDGLELLDVALGETAPVGGGALRHHQAHVLVHHQGARMGLEDLRGDADGVDRLIQREVQLPRSSTVGQPVPPGHRAHSLSHSPMPSERELGVVWALIRNSWAPSLRPRSTSSFSP